MKVTKAVIPAAGLGTRFLPVTKAIPKEMLPIIDTPTIQYVVEEAVASGLTDILIIIGKGKQAIADFFDHNHELEQRLRGKNDPNYAEIARLADMASIHFIRQPEQNGLGDAIRYARHHVGAEPFAVLLGDTIIDAQVPATKQLMDMFAQFNSTIIAGEFVPWEKVSRYGVIAGEEISPGISKVTQLVEKPTAAESPSNLVIAGRYILTPGIFAAVEATPRDRNNEIQLTDALRKLLATEAVYSGAIRGRRYDIGNRLDYLKTQIEFGLKREEFAGPLRIFLNELARSEFKTIQE
ncbi:MAG: UTP--glucose-1-phosphate uridylyltransferase GalU [Candidatus Zhuqueibacterota bacterium]